MGSVNLFIEKSGKFAVVSRDTRTRMAMPPFYLADSQALNIQALDQTGTDTAPFYSVADLRADGLRVAVTNGDDVVYCLATDFTWSATNKRFEGVLPLNTAELSTAFDAAVTAEEQNADGSVNFTLEISTTSNRAHIFRTTIKVFKVADVVGADVPIPVDEYPTKNEVANTYVKKRHVGEFILVGDDGTEVTLKCVGGKLTEVPANS